jgi:hypothetical protein
MSAPWCVSVCSLPYRSKPGIMEPEERAVVSQKLSKHIPAETNTRAIIEEQLSAVFPMRLVFMKYLIYS